MAIASQSFEGAGGLCAIGRSDFTALLLPLFICLSLQATARVGANHRVTQEEARKWFVDTYEGLLV